MVTRFRMGDDAVAVQVPRVVWDRLRFRALGVGRNDLADLIAAGMDATPPQKRSIRLVVTGANAEAIHALAQQQEE